MNAINGNPITGIGTGIGADTATRTGTRTGRASGNGDGRVVITASRIGTRRGIDRKRHGLAPRSRMLAGAAVLAAAAFATVACGTPAAPQASAWPASSMTPGVMTPGQPGVQTTQPQLAASAAAGQAAPVAVNCGAGQQALIRPAVINGQAVSQVDCVAVAGVPMPPAAAAVAGYAYAPVASAPYAAPSPYAVTPVQAVSTSGPVYAENARPATYRTARTNDDYVEYRPARRVKSGRSWKKSAVIIGSSAGVGAGVGAAAGGKKGALIGAAIGGGGAAIWDQITRKGQ